MQDLFCDFTPVYNALRYTQKQGRAQMVETLERIRRTLIARRGSQEQPFDVLIIQPAGVCDQNKVSCEL